MCPVRTEGPARVQEQLIFTRLAHDQAFTAFALVSNCSVQIIRIHNGVFRHLRLAEEPQYYTLTVVEEVLRHPRVNAFCLVIPLADQHHAIYATAHGFTILTTFHLSSAPPITPLNPSRESHYPPSCYEFFLFRLLLLLISHYFNCSTPYLITDGRRTLTLPMIHFTLLTLDPC